MQAEDGTLYVRCPDEVAAQYATEVPLVKQSSFGALSEDGNKLTLGKNGRKSVVMFGKMPTNCKITAKFVTTDDIGDFGLVLRSSDNLAKRYEVRFEAAFNRLCFDKFPRKDNTLHVNVDVERYCPIVVGQTNTLTVICEGSVLEVYVNDRVAMSARMFDHVDGDFGLYAKDTQVTFEDVKLYVK